MWKQFSHLKMPSTIFYSTLPNWPAKFIIDNLLNKIKIHVDKVYFNDVNIVIDTTWANDPETKKLFSFKYQKYKKVDNIFLCNFFDPILTDIEYPTNTDYKTFLIGNVLEEKNRISTHAIILNKLFKKYNVNELLLNQYSKKFLCYQNKPTIHRTTLTKKILENNLLDSGIVTLNTDLKKSCSFDSYKLWVDECIEPEFTQDNGVTQTNNPYSLGELKYWNSCFLNVISETTPFFDFITEKTFKPIIGLRPFVINGHPNILKHLETNNFYTFEEYWPVNFRKCTNSEMVINCIIDVLKFICSLTENQIKNMYADMLPKLFHNRQQFYKYALVQEEKINFLFYD